MKSLTLFIAALFLTITAQAKPVELVFWHAMAGHLGDEVRALTDDFNHSQKEYVITPVYKGDYLETLTSFAAAFRAHKAPSIVQIFEVGTALMRSPKGVIKPVEELMREQGQALPVNDFIQSVRTFYSEKGQLVAMPFNLSAPILYYNRDILEQIGYNNTNFPKTWAEMEILAVRLKAAGYDCTYTTAYPGWVLFESFMAIHGLAILADNPLRAVFDTEPVRKHFARLQRWHQQHYFRYAGRIDDATILFTSKVCPLFSQSSGAYNSLANLVPFRLGVATMPLDTTVSSVRYANVAGGAALWAVAGQTSKEYQGIAQFFVFLARPEVQSRWHEHTGYLPLGVKGVYASIARTSTHPNLVLARDDLEGPNTENATHHLGPQNQIRNVADEVLEALFAELITPDKAMKEAVNRSNHILLRFVRNTKD